MTDLSPHLPYGDISPTNNLSSGDFLHMTICHVEKFLHMADFFSTTSGCDGCDKYQVCQWHYATISKSGAENSFTWKNKAGVEWELTFIGEESSGVLKFKVGEKNKLTN